jgi:hypothetical protein
MAAEQATAPLTHGNLALAEQPANVVEFKPRLSVVPEPKAGKSKAGKSKGKTISTKEECDWIKSRLPQKVSEDHIGYWAVTNRGAGFEILFRVDPRYSDIEVDGKRIGFDLRFPYISRRFFLLLKEISDGKRTSTNDINPKRKLGEYVISNLKDAIEQGDSRGGWVAGKLRAFT